ncbi:MAG: hypothetical protein ACOC6Q_02180 [Patescibacteria group bacterium]
MEEKKTAPEQNILESKPLLITLFLILLFTLLGSTYIILTKKTAKQSDTATKTTQTSTQKEETAPTPQGVMFLIEYKDTVGLTNFVNEMSKREVPGLLMVTPEFVQENCADIKEIIKHNVEIVGCNVAEPFWDIPYEEQKARIEEIVEGIETCTGEPVRIISSRYFASDANTIEAAEELGIPYVTARGTTDTKATVFQPEGYNVKVLSVSNIPSVKFKYGSLCDYSYFERGGTPEDLLAELDRALLPLSEKEKERFGTYHRVTPVTHTNIGGYLKPWTEMWQQFWDTSEIEWASLDQMMEQPDWTIPLWQIPINKNAPYTPEKIRPVTSYEEEEKVGNPCAVDDLAKDTTTENTATTADSKKTEKGKVYIYHNNQGSMCLQAIDFLQENNIPYQEKLSSEQDFMEELDKMKSAHNSSEGVSENFGYYPIIFINNKAFSGFNQEIEQAILQEINN